MKKNVIKNLASSIMIYGMMLLLSLIVSRLVLVGYGSETNGFLSSANQIFSYIALLEAGIGTATICALYTPIAQNDIGMIKEVIGASKIFYRKSAVLYLVCSLIVAAIWPFVLDTNISYFTMFGYIALYGISSALSFWFTSTITNYLVASGKNYINNYVHIITTILTYVSKIIICYLNMNIVFISLSFILINIVKCGIYLIYIKKSFPEFFLKAQNNQALLKQRNSFLLHEISGVIFSSTDTILISAFCGLIEASIYTVYSLVTNAINTVMWQALNGTYYILGDSYSKDKEKYVKTHDLFNSVLTCISFAIFTTAYILILPFVGLYTQGVNDANYLDPKLPILFVVIQLLSICRMVDNYLIKISLHAKQTIVRSIIESIINLVVSLALVNFIGIYGVLIGTIVALLYRTNDIILYVNKKILKRSPLKEYGLYAFNFLLFIVFVIFNKNIHVVISSYLELFVYAVIVFLIVFLSFCLANGLFNYRQVKAFVRKRKNM